MSVKLSEVMSATHARRASLAAEVAGYLVLAVADQVAGAPRSLGFADVSLGEEGQVKLAGGTPSPDVSAERCLRAMLEAMLLESSSVTPGLMRASQKAAGAGVETLIREIEVALVPVNRAAARRALARLHKDVIRALERGNLAAWQPRVSLSDSPSGAPAPVPEERRPAPPPLPVAAATADATSLSVDLPAVLAEEPEEAAFSEVGSSAFLPREVAVVEVAWPSAREPEPALELADELVVPVYIEEPSPALEPLVPDVPDLVVPPTPEPRARFVAPEPVTVPQPLVAPLGASESRPHRESETPVLGSPAFEPVEISEAMPGALILAGDDATERVPEVLDLQALGVECPDLHEAEIAALLDEDLIGESSISSVATARVHEAGDPVDDALRTEDPPALAVSSRPAVGAPAAAPSAEPPSAVEIALESDGAIGSLVEPISNRRVLELIPELDAFSDGEGIELVPRAELADADGDFLELVPAEDLVVGHAFEPAAEEAAAPSPELASNSPPRVELHADLGEADARSAPPPVFAEPISPVEALERLRTLPARPMPGGYAPPRYAPRQSDVGALLGDFSVADTRSVGELCADLKALAGVEGTAPPPAVELSETPPPVMVADVLDRVSGPRSGEEVERRGLPKAAGAATAALVVATLGFGALANRHAEAATGAMPRAFAERAAAEPTAPACSAELTVRQVPLDARARLRVDSDRAAVAPSRVVGSDAVFEGLACGQDAEVTIEMPGRVRWVRIPIRKEALTPSPEAPSLVRLAVSVR